jgi:hypothetical protein
MRGVLGGERGWEEEGEEMADHARWPGWKEESRGRSAGARL